MREEISCWEKKYLLLNCQLLSSSNEPLNTFRSTSSLIPGTLPTSVCCQKSHFPILYRVNIIMGNPVRVCIEDGIVQITGFKFIRSIKNRFHSIMRFHPVQPAFNALLQFLFPSARSLPHQVREVNHPYPVSPYE